MMAEEMSSSNVLRLVFGLVAPAEKSEASASFDELAAWLRANHDLELERKAWPTYRALSESVREGKSDVAWLPPVVYAWLAEAVNPLGSIVRGGSTTYSAALVVREDSSVRTLGDLSGKRASTRAGWVDPWSAAGYVVPRIELARAGIDPAATFASETFYGSHRDTLLALGRGDCDIAGTYARTRDDDAAPEGAWSELEDVSVRVVATFGSIPSDVIAVRRNLAPRPYERVLEAFRGASADEAARPLVRAVFGGDALREGIEPGHDALRIAFERATANGLFD
jgi:phosphate/phosphite/phosphonate ABC transporter binding protein